MTSPRSPLATPRLAAELQRLYQTPDTPPGAATQANSQGRHRALVLELAEPADWGLLSAVWQGVQADLGLPAPAIAVSGGNGLQLWFSLQDATGHDEAHVFLSALRQRYLPALAPHRLRTWPTPGAATAPALPPRQTGPAQWAAFVAPDLVGLFAETPWLDLPPGDDGQASLLASLTSISPRGWREALAALAPASPAPSTESAAPASAAHGAARAGTAAEAAQQFLLSVMDDATQPMAQRIDAARALLGR